MLLAPVPWANRVWAFPFLAALAPSERYNREHARRHKRLTDWARQLLLQTRRWLDDISPGRTLIMVADTGFAALGLFTALAPSMTCITRIRLDAQLYAPAPERPPGTNGRRRKKGVRLPTLKSLLADTATEWQHISIEGWYGEASQGTRDVELATGIAVWYHGGLPVLPIRWVLVRDPLGCFDSPALLSTNAALEAADVVRYFVRRWQVEITFEEMRRHLGVETQHQWSDLAIARTTPVLLGLFSIITLLGAQLSSRERDRAPPGSLVSKIEAYLQRYTSRRTTALLARNGHERFCDVRRSSRTSSGSPVALAIRRCIPYDVSSSAASASCHPFRRSTPAAPPPTTARMYAVSRVLAQSTSHERRSARSTHPIPRLTGRLLPRQLLLRPQPTLYR